MRKGEGKQMYSAKRNKSTFSVETGNDQLPDQAGSSKSRTLASGKTCYTHCISSGFRSGTAGVHNEAIELVLERTCYTGITCK